MRFFRNMDLKKYIPIFIIILGFHISVYASSFPNWEGNTVEAICFFWIISSLIYLIYKWIMSVE